MCARKFYREHIKDLPPAVTLFRRLMTTEESNVKGVTSSGSILVSKMNNLGHIKSFLFPVTAHINFQECIKKIYIFYFIEFDVFGTSIDYFSVKANSFCPLF